MSQTVTDISGRRRGMINLSLRESLEVRSDLYRRPKDIRCGRDHKRNLFLTTFHFSGGRNKGSRVRIGEENLQWCVRERPEFVQGPRLLRLLTF